MHYLRDVKIYFDVDVIFNIKQVEMSCVTFVSTQHDAFIKRVKWVGLLLYRILSALDLRVGPQKIQKCYFLSMGP